MPPSQAVGAIAQLQQLLQLLAYAAVVVLAVWSWLALRGSARGGNRVQIDLDMQVIDVGASRPLIGEVVVELRNLGNRHQKLWNLFLEIRSSRHLPGGGGTLVPVINLIDRDSYPLLLAPGVRQRIDWTFEIPREERLLRATTLINTERWQDPETIPELSKKHFFHFGPGARYASRVFEATPSAFRRF